MERKHNILYYLLLEDKQKNPMRESRVEEIRTYLLHICRKLHENNFSKYFPKK